MEIGKEGVIDEINDALYYYKNYSRSLIIGRRLPTADCQLLIEDCRLFPTVRSCNHIQYDRSSFYPCHTRFRSLIPFHHRYISMRGKSIEGKRLYLYILLGFGICPRGSGAGSRIVLIVLVFCKTWLAALYSNMKSGNKRLACGLNFTISVSRLRSSLIIKRRSPIGKLARNPCSSITLPLASVLNLDCAVSFPFRTRKRR